MATQSSFILAEEELSCPICFEEFSFDDVRRRPKLLLCLHTFCSGCMETLRKYDGTLLCSICRTSHTVHRVNDLLENYVIFEHLRLKQESEDETLAMQLRDEYDIALRRLQEQEERDAVIAKEEAEKIRIEIERQEKVNEDELKRLEEERVRQDDARRRLEEERIKREEQERLIMEENERKQNECEDTRLISDVEDVSDDIYSCTNTSDSDGESSEESNDSSDNEEESPFHDVDETQTEDEEAMMHIRSYSSLNSEDDYITIGNDSDHHSSGTISVSSEDEEEMGTAVSGIAPISSEVTINLAESSIGSISPEPDFLSDEFSGVAQSTVSKRPKDESLSDLLPSVQCCERADGSIVVLNEHVDKSECSSSSIPKSSQQILISNTKHLSASVDCAKVAGSDDSEWVDIDTSEDEALHHSSHSYRPVKNSNVTYACKPHSATKISNFENENCKIQ